MDDKGLNKEISQWAKGQKKDLDSQFDKLDIQHREGSPSPQAARELLRHYLGQKFGMVSKITFKFPRHMVFVQKGVGKGTPAAQAGTGKRKPKDWFNGPIDEGVERLADIVAEGQADMIINSIRIK